MGESCNQHLEKGIVLYLQAQVLGLFTWLSSNAQEPIFRHSG